VDLHRQFLPGVDELEQQREAAVHQRCVTEDRGGVSGEQFAERPTGVGPVGDEAGAAVHVRKYPRLADRPRDRSRAAEEGGEPAAAPKVLLEDRLEPERRQGTRHRGVLAEEGRQKDTPRRPPAPSDPRTYLATRNET
jgi:hypothetical protein